MRKILLASSALILAATPGYAADNNNLKLQLSGYADFRAGFYDQSPDTAPIAGADDASHDFETETKLNFDVMGKAANNVEYGGRVSLWNGANANDGFNGGEGDIRVHEAYVYMGGNWGKVLLGDSTGASDLFVYAPVVGQGQIDGSYTDFTSNATTAPFFPSYIDNEETSTKATYYTPVFSGFQVGLSYAPQFYDYGQNVVKYNNNASTIANGASSPYQDYVEAAAQYNTDYRNANIKLSALMNTASRESEFGPGCGVANGLGGNTATTDICQEFLAWGVGGQVGFGGLTVGASYNDAGDFLAPVGSDRDQTSWTVGATYEFGKAGVGASFLQGEGWAQGLGYIDDYKAVGVGGEYNWLPGLVTSADVVYFDQAQDGTTGTPAADRDNDGYVFLVSQRVNF